MTQGHVLKNLSLCGTSCQMCMMHHIYRWHHIVYTDDVNYVTCGTVFCASNFGHKRRCNCCLVSLILVRLFKPDLLTCIVQSRLLTADCWLLILIDSTHNCHNERNYLSSRGLRDQLVTSYQIGSEWNDSIEPNGFVILTRKKLKKVFTSTRTTAARTVCLHFLDYLRGGDEIVPPFPKRHTRNGLRDEREIWRAFFLERQNTS